MAENQTREFGEVPAVLREGETLESWEGRRSSLINLIAETEYGVRPDVPYDVSWTVTDEGEALSGAAVRRIIDVTVTTSLGSHTFPAYIFLPAGEQGCPATILICSQSREAKAPAMPESIDLADAPKQLDQMLERFGIKMDGPFPMPNGPSVPLDMADDMDNGYWPVPAVIARGHAVAGFYATDAEADDANAYPSGLATIFGTKSERGESEWGALAVWAFAASCVLDCLADMPEIDSDRIGVIGHSRCGKAALWAGATDERFRWVVPNNSGCCGAALLRGKHGENLASINAFFPHWFAPGFKTYVGREDELLFDQHEVLALVAPRILYVTSASEDYWSDPVAEHESAVLASAVWGLYGCVQTLPEEMPEVDAPVHVGAVGYHMRRGPHKLTEYDWMRMLDHVDILLLDSSRSWTPA